MCVTCSEQKAESFRGSLKDCYTWWSVSQGDSIWVSFVCLCCGAEGGGKGYGGRAGVVYVAVGC